MARPIMLGNGQLTVGLNENGLVHDFYFPYVGQENLTTSRSVHHKIGVWVDGAFSWIGEDGQWDMSVLFEDDAMISSIYAKNNQLQIAISFKDFVDSEENIFCRTITVHNLSETHKSVRIFMHQVFQISRDGRADTALYEPEENYLLDYKGRACLLISGQLADGTPFDQHAVGNYGIEGKKGTFVDAEDGELSNNDVEHGGVDSVLRMVLEVPPHETTDAQYWIIAANAQDEAEIMLLDLRRDGVTKRLEQTRKYWQEWLRTAEPRLREIDEQYRTLAQKSLMVIKVHTDVRGGVIASCDSSIYNYGRDYYSYVWPRDGAYAMWPLIRLGYTKEPEKFFEFCRDIISPKGYIRHKFQPDKSIGSTWHPLVHGDKKELAIQEDETAVVVYMLGEYYDATNNKEFIESVYPTLIQPAANFMHRYIDEQTGLPHASYDLWEEKFLTTTYTVACVYEALQVAADFAELLNYPADAAKWRDTATTIKTNSAVFFNEERQSYRKGFLLQSDGSLSFDNTIDMSSTYGVMLFAGSDFGAGLVQKSMQAYDDRLLDKSPSGGAPRYENDGYFASKPAHLGNPWFVTTFWAAQYYIRAADIQRAQQLVDWSMQRTLPSGVFSEQIHPETGVQTGVAPLVWSHSEYINTVLDLAKANSKRT